MANCPNCNTDHPNLFFNGVLYPPDGDGNIFLENTVERADGTLHQVGPGGFPCVAPDLTVCDPATGQARPVAKLEPVVTENNLPCTMADPDLGIGVQHGLVGPGGWPIAFDTNGLSPVVELPVTNPDLCRPATATVEYTNVASLSLGGGYSAGDIRLRVFIDRGDGVLNLISSGSGVNHAGDGPDHPRQDTGFINSDRWSVVRQSVPIPPGGTITVRMQTDMTTTINILSPWTAEQVVNGLADGRMSSNPSMRVVGLSSGRIA